MKQPVAASTLAATGWIAPVCNNATYAVFGESMQSGAAYGFWPMATHAELSS